jgi:putative ABC transport system substrate-binding protein
MRRREFITLLGGVAAAWPLAARAQQGERVRRIGVLSPAADPEARARHAAFLQALQQLGWTDGRNVHIDARWSAGNAANTRKYASELAALAPDVILTFGSAGAGPMLQATRTVPIVFAIVPDPVGSGFVNSLSRPGGNATGFMMFEYSLCGKWVELLKEIAPRVTRAAVLRDPAITAGIESAVSDFARFANGGLISTASALSSLHRDLIIKLAAQHKLPAVYQERSYVAGGGLTSYGPNFFDQYRRAAGYVDRILKGEKPGDLPVQAPTKYELVINLKTAKTLGLTVPPTLLARADEVIE